MGCSNARLLVQAPMSAEPGAGTTNPLATSTLASSPANASADTTNNTTTRMHLTGVDLVVERNGSYTLLLTPKTHKQLMPYVLRKKRFRILVDKPRSDPTTISNEPNLTEQILETKKDSKMNSKKEKKSKATPMESTIESMEQVASDELNKAKARFIGGRSIDRGNPEDDDMNIQSDDEGMIEEIVTTVEEDKDLECKIKKKIETKKTIAQDPETHNTITKVVKTEVTEITRTITINDQHDLERAKRELGIDDVNRLLPSASWMDQSRIFEMREKRYEPINEVVTSKDFPSDSPAKQLHPEEKPVLAESTMVGRGPVTETITVLPVKSQQKPIETKKKKKKSKLCSCTHGADDEHDKQQVVVTPPEQIKKTTSEPTSSAPIVSKSATDLQLQGQQLISSDIKQLIIDKKSLLIEYIHSKIFSPSKLFTSTDDDIKARKISSRILDLLRYDRCSSWPQMSEQLTNEYSNYLSSNVSIQPILNTYENLFTTKQSNLLNTFSTIHNGNDIGNIHENHDYLKIVQTYLNEHDHQPKTMEKQTADNHEHAVETVHEVQMEKAINDDEHPIKEIIATNDIPQQILPNYNEEYLVKMLADISQHKPITLAEAIAYEYIDIEDPKLGLATETIQRIKKLFHPLSDESASNLIRVKRSGEYLTDINLAETNPFERLNLTEPFVYQLQQSFEPTLDFSEKQFRSLTEAILNNKEQYDQLQFDIARTSVPIYDTKDLSINDVSQSDSGYSMTTATHESLASKIKIEFEPIHHDTPVAPKRNDLYEDEKVDLDKATQEQLDKYELNHDLIQIIKSDFSGSEKTIGQAILSRELRLDSTDPSDISYLNSLGIHKEQIRILTALFFPKQSRIIAYSPEPGRFVEAQTTYNPDYSGYKTDTTIIQIQEKQLSSDHLAMQRNIHDDRTSPSLSQGKTESETMISSPSPTQEILSTVVQKEKTPPPPPPPPTVHRKKRKSSGQAGLLSCFKSKKPKAGTEQQGQATVKPAILVSEPSSPQETVKTTEEKPLIDYALLPDGKRIYIDNFRDRPGMDMSYRPDDFENRFILPITKPASEYERALTPEIELTSVRSDLVKEQVVPLQSEISEHESITDFEAAPETIEHKIEVHLEARPATIESVDRPLQVVEHKTQVHLAPRPATIEPVDVQAEKTPIVIPSKKTEPSTVTKKPAIHLHGAAVTLPEVELVQPGPLPTLPITKNKTSTGGLCASCFGAKSAEHKKKKVVPEPIPAPLEQKKSIVQEKKEELPTIILPSPISVTTSDESILPRVNIDTFKERNFEKSYESLPRSEDRLDTTITSSIAHQYQSSSNEQVPSSVSTTKIDASIFSRVNIDSFKERTFDKSFESLPKSQERLVATPPPEEPHYQLPTNGAVSSPPPKIQKTDNLSAHGTVNIDIFKERTFQKSSESLPKSEEHLDATVEKITTPPAEEPHYQLLTNKSASPPSKTPSTGDLSPHSKVNIDTFKERTFDRSFESLPKSQERLNAVPPAEEPHYQLPTNELVSSPPRIQSTDDLRTHSKVNIDTFKERTFDRSFESLPKSQERLVATPPPVEPLYQLPTNAPISSPPPKIQSTDYLSSHSKVNIDTFKERTFGKSFESLPKSQERLNAVPPAEEPHYQLPINESVARISTTQSTSKDFSVYSNVNIDTFKERTFDKSYESLPKQEARVESLGNDYSTTERNAYDIPRCIELQHTTPSIEIKTDEQRVNNEVVMPPTTEMQKSGGDFLPTEHGKSKIKETKKKSSTSLRIQKKKLKTEKKAGLFSTLFRHSERKSKVPALDLPPIERDLSPNNQLHQRVHDPLHIPSIDLPKLDLPLPTYSRPEVKMTTGHIKQSSEFSIPVVDLPAIPNLQLPDVDKRLIDSNSDLMKVPHVHLPDLQFALNEQEQIKLPHIEFQTSKIEATKEATIQTGLALASPVEDMLSIQTDRKNFPIETDYAIKTETVISTTVSHETEIFSQPPLLTTEEKYTITQIQQSEPPLIIENQINRGFDFQLPSPEPILSLPKDSKSRPPSFDDDVPSSPSKLVPSVQSPQKQLIETKSEVKKKSSTLALCSCFGDKSTVRKETTHTFAVPKASLPEIEMPIPSSNISSTLKTKGSLRAPGSDLPLVDLTLTPTEIIRLPTLHLSDKKPKAINETEAVVPSIEIKKELIAIPHVEKPVQEELKAKSDIPITVIEQPLREEIQVKSNIATSVTEKRATEDIKNVSVQPKKSSSFVIKAPAMNIPEMDLSGPPKSDAYLSLSKQESTSIPEHIQSRSDSGLGAIISSHMHPSSTFGTNATLEDIQQHPSISSGLGSEILDNITAKGYSLPDVKAPEPTLIPKSIENNFIKHDFTRKITMNEDTRAKLIFRQDQLKTCLETEIGQSVDDFDAKKDHKTLDRVLTHAIDLIKDKKVATYPELKQKLIIEHKNDAFIVDPIVRSLYCAIEKQGLDNLDKPEFPLAIRDMVRLPAKQTYDTVTYLNREATSLTTTPMTKDISSPPVEIAIENKSSDPTGKPIDAARSCLTCGRSKSKSKLPISSSLTSTSSASLLDERRRLQLNTHRHELGNILRDHIQSSQPPIRKFADHPKESEKIVRKSLILISQPKIHSYEQMRNDLKTEHKQTFYLVDPTVDIIRDTFDHCDITQLNEKTNLDILDSNICQTAKLYNNQYSLLTSEEHNAFKANQLSWLQQYLINNELKEKKLTRKQTRELGKVLNRNLEILSTNTMTTWDELALQLQREYPKAHDLCNRSVELVKQAEKDGLFLLQQAPVQDKRRPSSLITERARQNLKSNRSKIVVSLKNFITNHNKSSANDNQVETYLNKTFHYLEEQKPGQFKNYHDLKEQLKKDFHSNNQEHLIEQIVDVIEQAHATNQFDDLDKPEVQILMKDRLDGKPLVIKEMYVSLPARSGAYGTSKYSMEESSRYLSTSGGGDQTLNSTTMSHRVTRGLSWREANERARILFYRGKHPAIHYDEQAAAFDVRMLLETASGGTQEIPVTDSDVHELLNQCGVQWDGVNIISLVDHSEDVVRAAEQAALKVIREKGIVNLSTPPAVRNLDTHHNDDDNNRNGTVASSATTTTTTITPSL